MLVYSAYCLVFLLVAAWCYVRFNPLEEAVFHVDPETAARPKVPGHVLMRAGGDMDSPQYEMSADELAEQIEAIILDTPRATHLAGDLSDGYATYIIRSGIWGFPDIANVKVLARGEKTSELVILSRLRYGKLDFGVNQRRVEAWTQKLSRD